MVEDDSYLRRDLKKILMKNEYDVVTASSVGEACSYVNQEIDFDLYLLDLWLQDGDGFEICKAIRRKNRNPIIFLTACDDEECVVNALNIGADDYVAKPFRMRELLSRISANLRRTQRYQSDRNVYMCGELKLDIGQGILSKNNEKIQLSPVEIVILQKLIENSECIVKREALLDTLWNSIGNCVEDNTLSVNISRIRNKIGGEYIETIRGYGYRFTEKAQRGTT